MLSPTTSTTWSSVTAAILFLMTSSSLWQPAAMTSSSCPAQCRCPTRYYVYCQSAGLNTSGVLDLLTEVTADILLLDLSDNLLQHVTAAMFDKFRHLESLSLANNSISSLPDDVFSSLSSRLADLDLRHNLLHTVTSRSLSGLTALTSLRLDHNQLTSVTSQAFRHLTSLTRLDLQHNNKLTSLTSGVFQGLRDVSSLNLSHCGLGAGGATALAAHTFLGLDSLTELDLSHNLLSHIPVDGLAGSMPRLVSLDLRHNRLADLAFLKATDFSDSVETINLSHNLLESLPTGVFPAYKKSLRTLDLSHNLLRRLGSRSFYQLSLDYLLLHHNRLTVVHRDMLSLAKSISHLDLGHNLLHDFKTGALDGIRESLLSLDVSHNSLTFLHTGMFRGMRGLSSLRLGDNLVSRISPGSFKDLEQLRLLDLSANRLQELSSHTLTGCLSSLATLRLSGNPLTSGIVDFRFEGINDVIEIEANSTVVDVTSSSSAEVTWPYKGAAPLYWTVGVTCLTSASSSSSRMCRDSLPVRQDVNLEPYRTSIVLQDLAPGSDYFVCVSPVFVSPEVRVSQCVQVRTPEVSVVTSPDRRIMASLRDDDVTMMNSGGSRCVSIYSLALWCLLVVLSTSSWSCSR